MSTSSLRSEPLVRRRAVSREVGIVSAAAIAVAAGMNWAVLARLGSAVPGQGVDPFIELWSLAWSGHALNPFSGTFGTGSVFSANAFYPARDSLAFTDSLLGLGPLTWPFGPAHVALAFGVIFVLGSALSTAGAYLLARQLGAHWLGAAVAGVAFAYAPWRLGQLAHLHVLSTGPMVLALAMLARGHGLRWTPRPGDHSRPGPRPLWVLLGWLAACWQLTIGFAGGLPFAYLMMIIALVVAVMIPAHAWFYRRPPVITWPVGVANAAGGIAFAVTGLLMAAPYLRVQDADPAAIAQARGLEQIQAYSPELRGLVTPPAVPGTWSWLTGATTLAGGSDEVRVLPGLVLLVVALIGVAVSAWRWRWRVLLLVAVAVSGLLALGSTLSVAGRSPFVVLHDHAPGWAADRTPGRLIAFTTLALALLAAGAVTAAVHRVRDRRTGRRRAPRAWLAGCALVPLLILAEGWGPVPVMALPPMPRAMRVAPGPMVVLPSVWTHDSTVMYWTALRGFPRLGNGQSGITPGVLAFQRAQLLSFPSERAVAYLRANGFRSVVVLRQDLGTDLWKDAGQVPDPALGLTRQDLGDSILFTVGPPPRA